METRQRHTTLKKNSRIANSANSRFQVKEKEDRVRGGGIFLDEGVGGRHEGKTTVARKFSIFS